MDLSNSALELSWEDGQHKPHGVQLRLSRSESNMIDEIVTFIALLPSVGVRYSLSERSTRTSGYCLESSTPHGSGRRMADRHVSIWHVSLTPTTSHEQYVGNFRIKQSDT